MKVTLKITVTAVCVVHSLLQSFSLSAQIDSALLRKITISDVSLCQTTLDDLKRKCPDLKKVKVQEMDSPEPCYGSRYVNGEGYASKEYPGMIFQLEEDRVYVEKIQLTKTFKGALPDGTLIDMENFRLKDVFNLYPDLKSKWTYRECSPYWKISNDTLAFYVKIDNKRRKFPEDDAFYYEQPVEGIDLTISCYAVFQEAAGETPELNLGPVFFLDSAATGRFELQEMDPNDIATVTVYKDSNAIKLVGPIGKNGVVYIHTKKFFREKYWNFLTSKSAAYKQAVSSSASDSTVEYMINENAIEKDFEARLAAINENNFAGLKVIVDRQEMKKLGVHNKRVLVLITTKKD